MGSTSLRGWKGLPSRARCACPKTPIDKSSAARTQGQPISARQNLKNIAEPIRVYSLQVGMPAEAKPATEPKSPEKPPEPKKRSMLGPACRGDRRARRDRGAAHGTSSARTHPRPSPRMPPLRPRPSTFRSSCCPSPISPAIQRRIISPTGSPRTSPRNFRASATASSSRATPLSPIKGKTIDAKEIGKELGVRYVLEGSVQRDQSRVRVNAQLIDAESGAHLWADRFEEDMADLFKLQDEVVARLANSLGLALTNAEAQKGARSKNPDAIDLTMRGWALFWRAFPKPPNEVRESLKQARALFDRALAIDPNDADALAGSANAYFEEYFYWMDRPPDRLRSQNSGSGQSSDFARPRQCPGLLTTRPCISVWCRTDTAKPLASPTPGSPSIPISSRSIVAAHRRRKFPRPLRTGQGRRAAGDAAEPARPPYRHISRRRGRRGDQPRPFRRGDRRISQGDRLGLSPSFSPTRTWPPPTRMRARWTRRSPPWPKRAASIPQSRSNG